MSAILKFDFQKREQLRFSEANYLNYTKKRPNFACGNYIFPKTRENKNKSWTHSTPLKINLIFYLIKELMKNSCVNFFYEIVNKISIKVKRYSKFKEFAKT